MPFVDIQLSFVLGSLLFAIIYFNVKFIFFFVVALISVWFCEHVIYLCILLISLFMFLINFYFSSYEVSVREMKEDGLFR